MSWDDFDDNLPPVQAVTFGGPTLGGGVGDKEGAADELLEQLTGVDASGNKRRRPALTHSKYEATYAKLSEDKAPIPLRVLIATKEETRIVTVETDTGYTYTGVLESVDANMNVKIRDAEVRREVWAEVKGPAAASSSLGQGAPFSSETPYQSHYNATTGAAATYGRKVLYNNRFATTPSTTIRGSSIVFIQLPASLEQEQRYLAGRIKKEIAEKNIKDKKERLERLIEAGKKRERELAGTIISAGAAGGNTNSNTNTSTTTNNNNNNNSVSGVSDKDKRKLAKVQEAARNAAQKLRKLLKNEARGEWRKGKKKPASK